LYSKLSNNYINFNILISHLYRVVKDINFSLRKIKMQHLPVTRYQKKLNIFEMLKKFHKNVKKYKANDIICIDETFFNSLIIRQEVDQ